MSNSLGLDLTDRLVILRPGVLKAEYDTPENRIVHVWGGFGRLPGTISQSIFVTWLSDGDRSKMDAYDVERLATWGDVLHAGLDEPEGIVIPQLMHRRNSDGEPITFRVERLHLGGEWLATIQMLDLDGTVYRDYPAIVGASWAERDAQIGAAIDQVMASL